MRDDAIIPFQVGRGAVRGRLIRLGPAIDEILSRHGFEAGVSELVGEAALLAALMGSSLKFNGKLTVQAKGEGHVRMLLADYAADGALRATATMNAPAAGRGLRKLMGAGHLAITIDQGPDMDRYQGVTDLDAENLEAAAVNYFERSEQIPTAVRLAVGRLSLPGEPDRWRAGGVIAQFIPGEGGARERGEAAPATAPEGEEWARAAAFLATTRADELLDPALDPATLLYRLFHEDGVRVFGEKRVRAECSCDAARIADVLAQYPKEDLKEMAQEGVITASCEFCRTEYRFGEAGEAIDL